MRKTFLTTNQNPHVINLIAQTLKINLAWQKIPYINYWKRLNRKNTYNSYPKELIFKLMDPRY